MVNKMLGTSTNRDKFIELLLRIGIAAAFIYPAVEAFFYPNSWVGFLPIWIRDLPISDIILLHLFGISEIIIAVWILVGKRIFIPCILATTYLILIITLNWKFMDLLFRDFAILVIPIVLAINSYSMEKERIKSSQKIWANFKNTVWNKTI
jgi:hypothetical protein